MSDVNSVIQEISDKYPNSKHIEINYLLKEKELVFVDKTANNRWNHIEFDSSGTHLWAKLSQKIQLNDYNITIKCQPIRMLLVKKIFTNSQGQFKPTIIFPSVRKVLSRRGFNSDEVYKQCRLPIFNFLKNLKKGSFHLDLTNMDKDLQKILNLG